jgi:hypothetical protein
MPDSCCNHVSIAVASFSNSPLLQVFTLLETLYRAFDEIAKRRRVFKVRIATREWNCYRACRGWLTFSSFRLKPSEIAMSLLRVYPIRVRIMLWPWHVSLVIACNEREL